MTIRDVNSSTGSKIFSKSVVLNGLLWKGHISSPKIRIAPQFDMGKRGWGMEWITLFSLGSLTVAKLKTKGKDKKACLTSFGQGWNKYHRLKISEFQGGGKRWGGGRKDERQTRTACRSSGLPYQELSDNDMYSLLPLSTLNSNLWWWQPLYTQTSRNQKQYKNSLIWNFQNREIWITHFFVLFWIHRT